jgi:hypothetical protein
MENFNAGVWNRLNFDGGVIVAPMAPTLAGNRRWVAIYKFDDSNTLSPKSEPIPSHKYSVLDFELKEELVDEYFSEEDKQKQQRFFVVSDAQLIDLLNELGVSSALFTYPWKCDYPL